MKTIKNIVLAIAGVVGAIVAFFLLTGASCKKTQSN